MKDDGYISNCLMLAKGILYDRSLRRKMMTQLVILLLTIMAIGSWVIDDWLTKEVERFLIFWGVVGLYALFIILMAFYDMLKVMRDQ